MQIEIDKTKCDECGTCISICPCDALTFTEALAVDYSRCSACARCVKICPFEAIALA